MSVFRLELNWGTWVLTDVESRGSCPEIMPSMRAVSYTDFVIGPA